MREIETPFEILYKGNKVRVTEHSIDEKRVFRVYLNKPLSITVAETRAEQKFWTSVPQGRQQEAEETGKLIANYIRSKRK
jgi:hypothetical protein